MTMHCGSISHKFLLRWRKNGKKAGDLANPGIRLAENLIGILKLPKEMKDMDDKEMKEMKRRKKMDDIHVLYLLMGDLFEIGPWYNAREGDIMAALDQKELDFENSLLSVCAQRAGCDGITAKKTKEFHRPPVKTAVPNKFLKELRENRLQ